MTSRRMTQAEMAELRQLDRDVSEKVFGRSPNYFHCPHFDKKTGRLLSFCACPDLPEYSRDWGKAREMEEELYRRNLHHNYAWNLRKIVEAIPVCNRVDWELIRATPRHRCLAALATVEGAKP